MIGCQPSARLALDREAAFASGSYSLLKPCVTPRFMYAGNAGRTRVERYQACSAPVIQAWLSTITGLALHADAASAGHGCFVSNPASHVPCLSTQGEST